MPLRETDRAVKIMGSLLVRRKGILDPKPITSANRSMLKSGTALCGAVGALILSAITPEVGHALPQGGTVVSGNATISTSGAQMKVVQTTPKVAINWQSYTISANELVSYYQPNSSAIALNRVTGGGASVIDGRLTATGQLWISNPSGILFGPNARVNVGGLIATTHDLRVEDFNANKYHFQSDVQPSGIVENQGRITVADAGLAAFVAPGVINHGIITARLGQVALASGNEFTVDLYGDQKINLSMDNQTAQQVLGRDGRPLDALVKNDGKIFADGGRVQISAAAAKGLVDNVVSIGGVVQARSVEQRNGEIVLLGEGGGVEVSGAVDSSGKAPGQRGGSVVVTGDRVLVRTGAHIDVSGSAGGGQALIGGDFRGGKATSTEYAEYAIRPARKPIPPAQTTVIESGASVTADALASGPGGEVIVWSEDATRVGGTLSARGGSQSGNGGFIETSGHWLDVSGISASTNATHGANGTWLLDPENVTIDSVNTTQSVPGSGGQVDAITDNTVIDVATLTTALASNNVIITTGSSGLQNGDITVASPISVGVTGTSTLNLNAQGNIYLNAGIFNTSGILNLGLNASGGAISGSGNISVSGTTIFNVGSGAGTYSGVSSSGSLTKTGTGTLVLSGVNTYSGATTVNAGTLRIGSGGKLGNGNYSGNLSVSPSATFTWASDQDQTFSSLAAGTGTVNLNGTAGTVTISGDQAFTGTLNIAQNVAVSGGSNGGASGLGQAAAININSGGYVTLDGSGNPAHDNSFVGYSDTVPITINIGGTLYNPGANSFHMRYLTLAGGTLASGAPSASALASGTFGLETDVNVTDSSIISAQYVQLVESGGVVFNVASGKSLNVSGTLIHEGTWLWGDYGIKKNGTGTLLLSGPNSFQGPISINTGTLSISNSSGLGSTSGVTVSSGATLDIQGVSIGSIPISLNGGTIGTSTGTSSLSGNVTLGATSTVDVAGTQLTLSGNISGPGYGLVKTSSGTLVLSGTNTYSGSTTINGGTLQLGGGGTTGSVANTSSIVDNGTLAFDRTDTGLMISQVISGTGAVTQFGSGTTTLTGVNTYSGATTVTAGTLQIGTGGVLGNGSYSSSLSVANGAAFTWASGQTQIFSNLNTGSGTINLNGSAGSVTISGDQSFTGTLNVAQNAIVTGGSNSGSGGLASAAAININSGGYVSLTGTYNSFIGWSPGSKPVTIYSGGVLYNANATSSFHLGAVTLAGGELASTATNSSCCGSMFFDQTVSVTENSIISAQNIPLTSAAFSGAGLTINVSTGKVLSFTGTIYHSGDSGTHDNGLTLTGGGTLLLSGANSFQSAISVNGGTLAVSNSSGLGSSSGVTVASGAALDLRGVSIGSISISLNGGTIGTSTGTSSLSGNVTLGATSTVDVSGTQFTLIGNISGPGYGLVKTSSGTLVLSGTNTYSGGTAINGGTLQLGGGGTTGSVANTSSIVDNGTLAFDRTDTGLMISQVISGTGAVTQFGSGTTTLTGVNTYSGATTVTAGTLQIGTGGVLGNGSYSSSLSVANGAAFTWASGQTQIFSNLNTGSGTINLNGSAGSVTISGDQSFTGTLNVAQNAIVTGGSNSGSGGLASAAAININSGGYVSLTGTYNSFIGWSPGSKPVTIYSGGVLYNANASSSFHLGAVTLAGGELASTATNSSCCGSMFFDQTVSVTENSIISAQNIPLTSATFSGAGLTINVSTGKVLSFTGTIYHSTDSGTHDNGLTLTGDGTLVLSGANSFQSAISVNGGTLAVSNSSGLGSSSGVTVASGATLDLRGVSIGSIPISLNGGTIGTSTGTSSLSGNVTLGATSTVDVSGTQLTLSGNISGSGYGLVKTSSGTLVLSGTNTYSGGTTISGGTLQGTTSSLQGNIVDNAALEFDQTTTGTYSGVISGSGTVTKSNTGTVVLTGANTYGGSTTIGAGTLQLGNGVTAGSLATSGVTNNGSLAFDVPVDTTVSYSISGSGNVQVTGAQTALSTGFLSSAWQTVASNMSVAEFYSRLTGGRESGGSIGGTVEAGIYLGNFNASTNTASFQIQQYADNGAGNQYTKVVFVKLQQSGANVQAAVDVSNGYGAGYTPGNALGNTPINLVTYTTNSATGWYGVDQLNLGAKVIFAGNNSYSGTTTLSNTIASVATGVGQYSTTIKSMLQIGSGFTSGSLGTGSVINSGILSFNRSDTATANNSISGSGQLFQIGSGTTILGGANSYTGGTTITTGTLQGTTSSLQGSIIDDAALVFDQTTTGSYSSVISGSGTVTKSNVGAVTFSNANSYSGATLISGGTLAITNALGLGSSSSGTTVAGGATLDLQNVSVGAEAISLNGGSLSVSTGSSSLAGGISLGSASAISIASGATFAGSGIMAAAGNGLTINGGGSISLTNSGNTIDGGLSIGSANGVSIVNSNALNLVGANTTGPVDIETLNGNLTISQSVATTDTSSSALKLVAAKNAAAGTPSGGDIIISGTPSISVGAGGIAALYTGSFDTVGGGSGSTGLVSLTGLGAGSGRFRYSSSTTEQHYTVALLAGLNVIFRETPSITVKPASYVSTYGAAVSPTAFSLASGSLVNGDVLTGTIIGATIGSTGSSTSSVGTYNLTIAGLPSYSSLGYGLAATANVGGHVINKAHLTVTPASQSRLYGQDNPTFTEIITGFVNEDTVNAAVVGHAVGTTVANALSGIGNYAIIGSTAGLSAVNYDFVAANGSMTINRASLTITANDATKYYDGSAYSGGSGVSYSGFVNSESSSVLNGAINFSGTSQDARDIGTYTIIPSGVSAANYAIRFVDGTLIIRNAPPPPPDPPAQVDAPTPAVATVKELIQVVSALPQSVLTPVISIAPVPVFIPQTPAAQSAPLVTVSAPAGSPFAGPTTSQPLLGPEVVDTASGVPITQAQQLAAGPTTQASPPPATGGEDAAALQQSPSPAGTSGGPDIANGPQDKKHATSGELTANTSGVSPAGPSGGATTTPVLTNSPATQQQALPTNGSPSQSGGAPANSRTPVQSPTTVASAAPGGMSAGQVAAIPVAAAASNTQPAQALSHLTETTANALATSGVHPTEAPVVASAVVKGLVAEIAGGAPPGVALAHFQEAAASAAAQLAASTLPVRPETKVVASLAQGGPQLVQTIQQTIGTVAAQPENRTVALEAIQRAQVSGLEMSAAVVQAHEAVAAAIQQRAASTVPLTPDQHSVATLAGGGASVGEALTALTNGLAPEQRAAFNSAFGAQLAQGSSPAQAIAAARAGAEASVQAVRETTVPLTSDQHATATLASGGAGVSEAVSSLTKGMSPEQSANFTSAFNSQLANGVSPAQALENARSGAEAMSQVARDIAVPVSKADAMVSAINTGMTADGLLAAMGLKSGAESPAGRAAVAAFTRELANGTPASAAMVAAQSAAEAATAQTKSTTIPSTDPNVQALAGAGESVNGLKALIGTMDPKAPETVVFVAALNRALASGLSGSEAEQTAKAAVVAAQAQLSASQLPTTNHRSRLLTALATGTDVRAAAEETVPALAEARSYTPSLYQALLKPLAEGHDLPAGVTAASERAPVAERLTARSQEGVPTPDPQLLAIASGIVTGVDTTNLDMRRAVVEDR